MGSRLAAHRERPRDFFPPILMAAGLHRLRGAAELFFPVQVLAIEGVHFGFALAQPLQQLLFGFCIVRETGGPDHGRFTCRHAR